MYTIAVDVPPDRVRAGSEVRLTITVCCEGKPCVPSDVGVTLDGDPLLTMPDVDLPVGECIDLEADPVIETPGKHTVRVSAGHQATERTISLAPPRGRVDDGRGQL